MKKKNYLMLCLLTLSIGGYAQENTLTIDEKTGNVGIGTDQPKAVLHVNGNVNVREDVEVKKDTP